MISNLAGDYPEKEVALSVREDDINPPGKMGES